jgi:molybdate transport system substrate-binding protein
VRRALALLAVLALPGAVAAAEITVLCPRAVQHVVAAAAEDFQLGTKHSVWLSYGTSGAIADRARTEEADVVIGGAAAVTELESKGAIRPGTRVVLGRVAIGVAVKAGTLGPDVTTTAALREALLAAPSLGYADPARGDPAGHHFSQVLDGMGIAPQVLSRTTLFADGPRALDALARGRIALVVAPLSEIAGVTGVTVAGVLPRDVQDRMVYAAGVLTRSAAPEAASAFLAHLTRPEARGLLQAGGLEPAD